MKQEVPAYEAPMATVVSFSNNEVTFTDSDLNKDGGHFGGDPTAIPDDPEF